jgi:HlyD family secretion protein
MAGRGRLVAAVVVVVVAAGLGAGWALRHLDREPAPVAVTGVIEAVQVDIAARITGRIVELPVRQGESVERGQLLVRLDPTELAAEVRRADAAVQMAAAQLRDLRAGARSQEIEEAEARLTRAEAQLRDLQAGARPQEIEQARAGVNNAAATRVMTEREFARVRDLFSRELVAAQDVDRARQAFEVAQANERAARERLALAEAGPRPHEVEAARAEVRAARERVALLRAGPRPDAVAAAEAQLAEARAAAALARARLAETTIVAPVSGLVLRKNAERGETATPGLPLLTLMDPTDMWLRAYVSETDVGRVRVGQRAVIRVDAYPERGFDATVSEVGSRAEFTPRNVQTKKERVNLVFRVRLAVRDGEGILKPGMPADAELVP